VRNSGKAPDRSFDASVVARAEELAGLYHIDVKREGSAPYVGRVVEMPTVFGCGGSRAAAAVETREMLKWALAYMLEKGRTPPKPKD
jgi:hypothetical protein